MPLPKLNVPVYETVLPSTEKVIKYRPFLVKEEKILLTAMEANDEKTMLPAVKQIINNCIVGKLDVEKLPTFDIEYLFLRLRAKSIGENVTLGLKPWGCPKNNGELCENSTQVEINLEEVNVIKNDKHSNKIMLDDEIGIKLGYPNLDKLGNVEKIDTAETGIDIIKDCIEMIFTEEETYERGTFSEKELDEFIDSLNTQQFTLIKDFFDTMPMLKHTVEYKCDICGEKKETTISGLNSFFG